VTAGISHSKSIFRGVSRLSSRVYSRTKSKYRTGALTVPRYSTLENNTFAGTPTDVVSNAVANDHLVIATLSQAKAVPPAAVCRRVARWTVRVEAMAETNNKMIEHDRESSLA